jgi:hypothetical protein
MSICWKRWYLFFVALFLCSCVQKLPPPEPGHGLVAVPFKVSNPTSYQLIRAIELKSSRDESFSLRIAAPPLNDDVVFSPPIPAGSYLIDYYLTKVVPVPGVNDGLRPQSIKLPSPVQISIEEGELHLFPLIFKATQSTRADYIYCRISHAPLGESQALYYRDKLSGMENGDRWRLVMD